MEDSDNNFEDIRISLNSKKNEVISLCKNILTNNNGKGLKLSAVGGSIGKLVDIVESLKILIPGIYQVNKLATVGYVLSLDNINTNNDQKYRLFPKMEVKLTLTMPTEITNGFQNKLSEEERKKFLVVYLKQKEIKERIEKERKERVEKERKERIEREIKERIEKERKEKVEKERIEREIKERIEKERIERIEREIKERIEKVKKERIEKERIERIEKERKEKIEKEKLYKELNDKYNIIKDDLPIPFKLDKTKYEKLGKSNNDKCLICLEIYKIGNQVLYLPCSHLFHSTCIMRWLLKDSKCPICKKDYRDLEDEDSNVDSNDDIFNEPFFEDNDEDSMSSSSSFEGGNLRVERGRGRGRGGFWRGRGGYWRGRRGNWRGRRGNWGGRRGNWRGRGTYIGQSGMQRGQRGRGGNYYYNSNHY